MRSISWTGVLLIVVLATIAPTVRGNQAGDGVSSTSEPTLELVFPAPPDLPRFVYERSYRGSGDVVKVETSQLRKLLTGDSSDGSEKLSRPYAIAVHKGRIYVSDPGENAVKVFDVPARKYYRIDDSERGGIISRPLGMDTDRAGNLYVADGMLKQVSIFDANGVFLRRIGNPRLFDRLSSVSVDPDGKRIYAVDLGGVGSIQHRVRVFDAQSGEFLFDIGKRGAGPGEFNLPRDVAIGKDGRIYVVDGGNFRIQIFSPDGVFQKSFGSVGKRPGQFARPKEISVDPLGNVYVVDTAFGNFQIFDPEGVLLMFLGERSEQDRPAGYMLPAGIAVDTDGRVYFLDQWFGRIDVFRPFDLRPSSVGKSVAQ